MLSVFRQGVFDGKVALITGGGTGIGLRTAKEMIYLGATVVIASRKVDVLQKSADELNRYYNTSVNPDKSRPLTRVHAVECNIRDLESIRKCVARTLELCGTIDYLVNNAGGQFPAPASTISEKGWKAVIDTNLTGTFLMSQHVYNEVFVPKQKGVIVTVIANMWSGFPGMVHTGAARSGVDNLTKTLAIEWARDGVRINCVAPGVVDSSGLSRYDPRMHDSIKSMGKNNYTFRLGTSEEVAACIIFLLSPAAAWITGETVRVDGGESLFHPLLPPVEHPNLPAWRDLDDGGIRSCSGLTAGATAVASDTAASGASAAGAESDKQTAGGVTSPAFTSPPRPKLAPKTRSKL